MISKKERYRISEIIANSVQSSQARSRSVLSDARDTLDQNLMTFGPVIEMMEILDSSTNLSQSDIDLPETYLVGDVLTKIIGYLHLRANFDSGNITSPDFEYMSNMETSLIEVIGSASRLSSYTSDMLDSIVIQNRKLMDDLEEGSNEAQGTTTQSDTETD